MSSFSPWGGQGEPGEACGKCGGKESMLGAHAPTRGLCQKDLGPVVDGATCIQEDVVWRVDSNASYLDPLQNAPRDPSP